MKIAKFLPFILGVMLVLSASAYADPVPPTPDAIINCSISPCVWTEDSKDLSIAWEVEDLLNGTWKYTYTIKSSGQGNGLSHFNLQVTPGLNCSDLTAVTGPFNPCVDNSDGSTDFGSRVADFIKFDNVTEDVSKTTEGAVFMFTSDRAPVLGMAGTKSGQNYLVFDNILRPNGDVPVPEPTTLLLLGTGLLGVGLLQRRRK